MESRNFVLTAVVLAVCIFQSVQIADLKEKVQRLENETQEAIRMEANNLRAELNSSVFELENSVSDFKYSWLSLDNNTKTATAEIRFSLKEYKDNSKIVVKLKNYENDGKGDYEVQALKTGLNSFETEITLNTAYDYVCEVYDVSNGVRKLNSGVKQLPLKSEYNNRITSYLNGSHENTVSGITNVTSEIRNNTFGNDMLKAEKAQLVIRMADKEIFDSEAQIELVEYTDGVEYIKTVSEYSQEVLKENRSKTGPTPEPQYFIRLTLKNGETYDVAV